MGVGEGGEAGSGGKAGSVKRNIKRVTQLEVQPRNL